MLKSRCLDIVLNRTGQRVDDQELRQQLDFEFEFIQRSVLEAADFQPWFLYKEANLEGVANQENLTLPANFLMEYDEDALKIDFGMGASPRYKRLRKENYERISSELTFAGEPNFYDMMGSLVKLAPIPDKAYVFKLRYFGRDVVPEAGQTNLWLTNAGQWVVGELGKVAAHIARDLAAGLLFTEVAKAGKVAVYTETVARQEAARDRMMGDAD